MMRKFPINIYLFIMLAFTFPLIYILNVFLFSSDIVMPIGMRYSFISFLFLATMLLLYSTLLRTQKIDLDWTYCLMREPLCVLKRHVVVNTKLLGKVTHKSWKKYTYEGGVM